MTVLWLPLLALVAVACGGMPGNGTGNFPLDGCSTDDIDFLFLYYNFTNSHNYKYQTFLAHHFAKDVVAFNRTAGRVQFAGVFDTFSLKEPQVDVSSWRFQESIQPIKDDRLKAKTRISYNTNTTIQSTVESVNIFFSRVDGVRENATHVAVLFLDGQDLSFKESRSVPDIVQQQDTDIKIFVVALGVKFETHLVSLRDTLLVGSVIKRISKQHLTMAICNRCSEGWFPLWQSSHAEALSCYLFYDAKKKSTWKNALQVCTDRHDSSLATIETRKEFAFLQKKVSIYINHNRRLRSGSSDKFPYSLRVAIGLERDTTNLAKRFHWSVVFSQLKHRPLVVNHWLPGKPSGGFSKGCGSWQFGLNAAKNDVTNRTIEKAGFVDGWVDIVCKERTNNFGLCEVVLPRRVDHVTEMRIKPATNESYNQAKGQLRTFKGNLVSVSVNVRNNNFWQKTIGELFPRFDCESGQTKPRYISYLFVCDGVDHCSNRRDEAMCSVGSQKSTKISKECEQKCCGVHCCDGSCLPLQYVEDGEVDCEVCMSNNNSKRNDEYENTFTQLKEKNVQSANCKKVVCRDYYYETNNHCKGLRDFRKKPKKLERAHTCHQKTGRFIWAPKCVYLRDTEGAILGCRDVSHLKGCTDFECPEGYLKCPDTYCIPQHYVLDGQADCPAGEEENIDTISPCTGNFACWDSKVCLHPDLVCDRRPDCPHQDDEVDCHVTCPESLLCISGTVTVQNYSGPLRTGLNKIDNRMRVLNLSGVDLSGSGFNFLNRLENITTIIFSHCRINNLNGDFFDFTRSLQVLDLSFNQLKNMDGLKSHDSPLENIRLLNLSYNTELAEFSSFSATVLETLDLSHTSVSQLDQQFLGSFPILDHLYLSFTKITNIHKITFWSRFILLTLDLRGLALTDLREDFFNGLTVSQDLYTDSFELCCPQVRGPNIPDHACHAPDDAISSCYDLVKGYSQRVLLWVVAVLGVLGNMTVIVYRVIWDRSVLRTGYGLFVTNLCISDFIMEIYLLIIAGADYYYHGVYVLSDKSWRESGLCRLAGFLATLSTETSTFLVFLITLDRFLLMKFPFGQIQFSKVAKCIILPLSWIIGFLIALIPIVFEIEIYSSNPMCLGLPLTTERLKGWEFSFAVFVVLNFCIFLLIVYGQIAIFRAMSENRVSQTTSRRVQDITVAQQLSLVALSNFLCWFPVGLMGLMSLGGHEISNDVYSWTMVIILPINSAANPLLYTIPAIMAKWERFKHARAVKKGNKDIDKRIIKRGVYFTLQLLPSQQR